MNALEDQMATVTVSTLRESMDPWRENFENLLKSTDTFLGKITRTSL